MTHDNVEGGLHVRDEDLSVLDLDAELSLEGVVDVDRSRDVGVAVLISEVRLEGDRNRLPSLRIELSQSLPDGSDDSLRGQARLKDRRLRREGRD